MENNNSKERFQVMRDTNRKSNIYLVDGQQNGARMLSLPLTKETELFFNLIAEAINIKEDTGHTPKQLSKDNTKLNKITNILQNEYDILQSRNKLLIEALEKIAKWELPETEEFWDIGKTKPMSYEACFGSNGVRDYFKNLAQTTLDQIKNN